MYLYCSISYKYFYAKLQFMIILITFYDYHLTIILKYMSHRYKINKVLYLQNRQNNIHFLLFNYYFSLSLNI